MACRTAPFPMTSKVTHRLQAFSNAIFTAHRYASAIYAVVVCLSVCPSVCLSQADIVPKGLNIGHMNKPYDSLGTLVFWCQRSGRNSDGVTSKWGAK